MFDENEEPQETPVLKISPVESQSTESLSNEPSIVESEPPSRNRLCSSMSYTRNVRGPAHTTATSS